MQTIWSLLFKMILLEVLVCYSLLLLISEKFGLIVEEIKKIRNSFHQKSLTFREKEHKLVPNFELV